MSGVGLIVCGFRGLSLPTHHSIVKLLTHTTGWEEYPYSEADIGRARSMAASIWWRETVDDIFLMVDDDIVFEPEDALHLVNLCRSGYDVIGGAYPFRDASRIAFRGLSSDSILYFGPTAPPQEVRHITTGFFAVHRKVLDAMIPTLPLCHANESWAFWPMFDFKVIEDAEAGGYSRLSEDYFFPVSHDTPVLGSDWRWRSLADYNSGDQVMAVDEYSPPFSSRRYRAATVVRRLDKRCLLWRIVTDEQEIITTEEHPWLTLRGWRRAVGHHKDSLKLGHPNKWSWTATQALRVGDSIAAVVPRIDSPVVDSDYMTGYVQGIFHSDGTLSRDNRRGALRMADIEAIDRAAEYLAAIGIRATRMANVWKSASPDHRQLYGLGVYQLSAAEKLGQLMDYEPIPSDSFAKGYLAGMYDGDGTHNGGSVLITNTSDVIKSRVVEAGHRLGLDFIVRPKWAYITGHDPMHQFWMSTCPAITRKTTPIGQRGNDGILRNREVKHRPVVIRAIEPLGRTGDVACLTTTSGTFIADGLASHNCELARSLGFKIWVDCGIMPDHLGHLPVNIANRKAIAAATI